MSYLQEHTASTCQQDTWVYILTLWLVWLLPEASGGGSWLLRLGAGALPASPLFLPRLLLSPVASESEATGGAFA